MRPSRRQVLAGALAFSCRAVSPTAVRVIVSSDAGDRMAEKPGLEFSATEWNGPSVAVDDARRFQTTEGFGATFNEAGLMCLNRLAPERQEQILNTIFDPASGAGFTLMKSPLAACDFAASGPMYFYTEVPGDTELKHFSVERDLRPTGLVTFIRRARRYGDFKLQTTTDYPPDWMLDEGMSLKPEYYDAFARYQIRYLQEYEKLGIRIHYLSPFNEPQKVYCRIQYSGIRDVIRNHLGPLLRKSGLETKLQVSDAPNRRAALENFSSVLDDSEARQYIDYMPVHGYEWDRDGSAPMGKLHAMYPNLPVWQTEVCHIRVTTMGKRPVPVFDFADGDWWGRMLIADINNWCAAWIYWNLILNEKGGPYMIDERHKNPAVNNQQPLVIIDSETGQVTYTGAYWYLAHFSKFVRPGAQRIAAEGGMEQLSFTAFRTVEGSIVLEVVNSAKKPAVFAIRHGSRYAPAELPAASIGTFLWG